MATSSESLQHPPGSNPSAVNTNRSTRYDQYLEERIEQTASQVRWVDLLSFFLYLTIFVLGFLFLLCLVDAWIWPLSVFFRWIALLVLAGGSLGYAVFRAAPYFIHRVNPLYAAKKLEEGRPELKNSVINYLTTEQTDDPASKSIRSKLAERTAKQVSTIPLDVAVDRSRMILAGYVLAGVIGVFAVYKILSPKDPFQTIGRVVMPTARWMAPSRVQISDIEPGDDTRYFGQSVEIRARIKGLRSKDRVRVLMSTESGTLKDFPVAMQREANSSIFRAVIGQENGLEDSFVYRIEAGDARSIDYRIQVRTCPTIFLEKIEYLPPAYTGLPDRTEQRPDRISGVEGARVKLHARTNLPVQSAQIRFYRAPVRPNSNAKTDKSASSAGGSPPIQVSELELVTAQELDIVNEFQVTGEIQLQLDSKRIRSRYSHYQVVFSTTEGDTSQNPAYAELEVIPDLNPEITVLAPQEKEIEVPANQAVKLELSAVDPDYGLTAIVLVSEHRGNRLWEKRLFRSPEPVGVQGKQVVQFSFQPDRFGLMPGDEVIWFAQAEDNRAVGPDQILVPNRVRTENYTIRVTEPLQTPDAKNPDSQNPDSPNNNQQSPENPNRNDRNQKDPNQKNSNQQNNSSNPDSKQNDSGSEGQQKNSSGNQPNNSSEQGNKKQSGKSSAGQNEQKNQPDQPSQESGRNSSGKKGSPKDSEGSGGKQQNQPNQQQGSNNEKSGSSGSKKAVGSDNRENPNSRPGTGSDQKQPGQAGSKPDSKQGSGGDAQGANENDTNPDEQRPGSETDQSATGSKSARNPDSADGNANSRNIADENNGSGASGNESLTDDAGSKNNPAGDSGASPDSGPKRKAENSREAFERLKEYFEKQKKNQTGENAHEPKSGENAGNPQQNESEGNDANKKQASNADSPRPEKDGGSRSPDQQPGAEKTDPSNADKSQKKPDSGTGDSSKKSGSEKSNAKQDRTGKGSPQSGSPKGTQDKSSKKNTSGKEDGSDAGNSDQGQSPNSDHNGQKGKAGEPSDLKTNPGKNEPGKKTSNSSPDQNSANDGKRKGNGKEQGQSGKNQSNESGKNRNDQRSKASDSKQPRTNSGGQTGDVDQAGAESRPDSNPSRSDSNSVDGPVEQAEKANLEYARKATEMVLEKLKEQKRPDEDLLKQLDWTEDELKEFTQKWEEMRRKAAQGDKKAEQRFEEALKALNLKDPDLKANDADLTNDDRTGYRQKSGTRKVPTDFARKFRAIQKSQRKGRIPGGEK